MSCKIADEFALSDRQRKRIETHIEQGEDGRNYVLQCAGIVRSEPRENFGRAFMEAFNGKWKKPVSNITTKVETKPQRVDVEPERPSEAVISAGVAELRSFRESHA